VKVKPKLFVHSAAERDAKAIQVVQVSKQLMVLFPEVPWPRRRRIPAEWRN
jgi:hypothetical protein